jgi:hypothetical protein
MTAVYSLPPGTEFRQPAPIYETGQLATVHIFGQEGASYSIDHTRGELLDDWIADLRRRVKLPIKARSAEIGPVVRAPQIIDSAAALKRVLDRTSWSLRRASEFFGCSHAQIGRVRDGGSNPRHDFAQQIADADMLTQALLPVASSDPLTLSRMLFSRPIDGAHEGAAEAFRRGDVYGAMALARRVLYPRSNGMIDVPQSPFSKHEATNAYLDVQ